MLTKERWIKNRMLELIEAIKNQLKDNVFSSDDVQEKHLKSAVCSKLLYNKKGQWFCECSKCGFDNPIGACWHKE